MGKTKKKVTATSNEVWIPVWCLKKFLCQKKNSYCFYNLQKNDDTPFLRLLHYTGKSLSEALISASTNPQYDHRLFIELQI